MIALAASALLMSAGALALMRVLLGPTMHDRALGAQFALLCWALALAAFGAGLQRPDLVDAGLCLLLASFVLALICAKTFLQRSLQPPLVRGEETREGAP